MKILFVRHGKDDDRYRGGWSKLDLTEEGVEQVMELALHLKKNKKEYNIGRIVSSDLQRALTTSEIIAKELELHITKEEAIRETNNGDLAGMLNEEALVKYPGMFFSSLDMDEAYPNGESPREFYVRIREWFENFVEEHKNDTIEQKKKVFKEIHEMFGGNIKILITGAAAIDGKVAQGYRDFGINLCQGYGLTETSPVVAIETKTEHRLGSIGKTL
jgi:bisphosphoglycerate-dependent phosphoglycerate mutase